MAVMESLWAGPSFWFLSRDPALSFENDLSHSSVSFYFFQLLSRILGFVPVVACGFAGLFLCQHCWRALCHCPCHVLIWLIIHSQVCVLFTREQMALLLVLVLYVISLHCLSYQEMRNGLGKSVISRRDTCELTIYEYIHSMFYLMRRKSF